MTKSLQEEYAEWTEELVGRLVRDLSKAPNVLPKSQATAAFNEALQAQLKWLLDKMPPNIKSSGKKGVRDGLFMTGIYECRSILEAALTSEKE